MFETDGSPSLLTLLTQPPREALGAGALERVSVRDQRAGAAVSARIRLTRIRDSS